MSKGKGNEFNLSYDSLYRLVRKENANNTSEYYSISYVSSGNGIGQVQQYSYTDGNLTSIVSYTYDDMGRKRSEKKQVGTKSYTLWYKYDDFGRIDSVTNSLGNQFRYSYDEKGYLTTLYYEGEKIWELEALSLTNSTEKYGDHITLNKTFNAFGQLTEIEAGDLFEMDYSFSATTGNLLSRSQKIFDLEGSYTSSLTENFTYDDLNRLLDITGDGDNLSVSYDQLKEERIHSKTDAGETYNYTQSNAFQLESIDNASEILSSRGNQYITYTSFNKVDSLTNGNYLINFDYGPTAERVRMQVSKNDTLQYTRYYFGSYELTEYPDSSYEQDTWFTVNGGIFGFNRATSTTDSTYYVIKDHLGSLMTIAGEEGNAREFLSYDAWGRRRNAANWSYDSTLSVNYTSRGYTGHEHNDEACLINMNGRVYDPIIGLFISPDPVIQNPTNPLNYNLYSYCLNNPLKYTDPSGYTSRYWERMSRNYDYEGGYFYYRGVLSRYQSSDGRGGGFYSASTGAYMGGTGYYYENGGYYNNGALVSYNEVYDNYIGPRCIEVTDAYKSQIEQFAAGKFDYIDNGTARKVNNKDGQYTHYVFLDWNSTETINKIISGIAANPGGDPSLIRKAWDYTYGAPLDFIGGAYDFAKNYHDLRKLNLKNSDKYFHSKANFQATKRGPGGA